MPWISGVFTGPAQVDLNIAPHAIDAVAAKLGVASVAADEIYHSSHVTRTASINVSARHA